MGFALNAARKEAFFQFQKRTQKRRNNNRERNIFNKK